MNSNAVPQELANAKEADWVLEMQKYFNENGTYRPKDLERVLGDPARGVELSSNPVEMKNVFMMAAKKSLYNTD
jgi:hypothetical protein